MAGAGAQKVSRRTEPEADGRVAANTSQWPSVHVVHLIPTLDRAGAETALSRIVGNTGGVRHTVIGLLAGGELRSVMEASGATVFELGMRRGPLGLLKVPELMGLVRDLQPDVIQGWMAHANLMAWLAQKFGSRSSALAWNLRMTVHDVIHERFETRLLTRLAGACSRSVDVLISNSSKALTEHAEIGYAARSTALIPNGFDTDLFKPDPVARAQVRKRLELEDDDVAFGLIGRFHPAKGHRAFLRAAAQIVQLYPQTRFILIGRTLTDNALLATWIEELGLVDRVLVAGETSEVHAWMPALDVVCAPSLYEGFPNVIGEAMAAGVACVATSVSDVPLILGDAGILVPPGDVGALAEAMSKMIEIGDSGRREFAARGRARAVRCYTIESAARQYEALYLGIKRA